MRWACCLRTPFPAGWLPTVSVWRLLAESSALVREGLRQMLAEMKDVRVVGEAGSCAELTAVLHSTPADLLLLDLGLPCPDLFSAIASHKTVRPELRVLALSQFASPVLERHCLAAGADYVLSKTAGLDRLIEVVRDFARSRSAGHSPLPPFQS